MQFNSEELQTIQDSLYKVSHNEFATDDLNSKAHTLWKRILDEAKNTLDYYNRLEQVDYIMPVDKARAIYAMNRFIDRLQISTIATNAVSFIEIEGNRLMITLKDDCSYQAWESWKPFWRVDTNCFRNTIYVT